MNITKHEIEEIIKDYEEEAIHIALSIWGNPEPSNQEFYASKIIIDNLKEHKFLIENKKGVETHIVAKFGGNDSKHKIGVLGEYDALKGTWIDDSKYEFGHGCGHNLLGAGSLLSAIVLSKIIKKHKLDLQIIYYGCPAEEEGAGKVIMAQKQMFKNLDACFTWHPAAKNSITNDVWIGSKIIRINFIGKEAHASMNSINGINANNLMVQVINFINKIKIGNLSYIINQNSQNLSLIPKNASLDIAIRSFKDGEINSTFNSINQFLKTMFSKNQFELIEIEEYPVTKHDAPLQKIVYKNFKKFMGEPIFEEREYKVARDLLKSMSKNDKLNNLKSMNIPDNWYGNVFNQEILYSEKEHYVYAPTDLGAICKLIPTIQFQTICMPIGVSVHTREATIFAGKSIGIKGMLLATKILVSSILDFSNSK